MLPMVGELNSPTREGVRMKKKHFLIIIALFLVIILIFGIAILVFKWESPLDFLTDYIGIKRVTPKELLQQAQTWVYDINFYDEEDVQRLADSNFDVVVSDIGEVDGDDVKQIKADRSRMVFCYMSIGQAEDYRDYWQEDWEEGEPDWISTQDGDWEGNYNVAFWDNEWKEILFGSDEAYLDKILEQGFDGVYLDTAGVSFWQDYDSEEEMIKLIEEISNYAKSKDKHFLVIAQNLGFLEKDHSERLKDKIDAVGQEEVFYGYENKDGQETPTSVSRAVANKLDKYKDQGLPIFTIDYPFICSQENPEQPSNLSSCYDKENLQRMRDSYLEAWDKGYIMYDQNREASGVTYSIPQIIDINVEYENLPILSWEVFSGNSSVGQSAYRIFVSSTQEKLENDEPDIYDSGKVWSQNKAIGFIPDEEIEDGKYYWKVVVYEHFDDANLISNWSKIEEFEYKSFEMEFDKSNSYSNGYQTAWIPNWGFDKGFESLKISKEYFESISPVWFVLEEDGSLKPEISYNNSEFMEFCRDNNIKIIPSIPQFDPNILSKVLNEHLDSHVDAIYSEVKEWDYDGIDLDYEATYLKDKELYFELLEKLSEKLHSDQKMLSVTVLSKWTDSEIYSFLPETRKVQDWERIAKYADEVRIMAYDYTSQNSYIPGPMSPIYWEDLIVKYAIEKIPTEKIVLALPLYGYSFRIDEKTTGLSTDIFEEGVKFGSERRVLAYTYEDIIAVGEDFEFEESYDEYSQEKVIFYNDARYDRDLYFEDEEAIKIRRSLAGEYGIKGVAYWRLGGEDSKSFE